MESSWGLRWQGQFQKRTQDLQEVFRRHEVDADITEVVKNVSQTIRKIVSEIGTSRRRRT